MHQRMGNCNGYSPSEKIKENVKAPLIFVSGAQDQSFISNTAMPLCTLRNLTG